MSVDVTTDIIARRLYLRLLKSVFGNYGFFYCLLIWLQYQFLYITRLAAKKIILKKLSKFYIFFFLLHRNYKEYKRQQTEEFEMKQNSQHRIYLSKLKELLIFNEDVRLSSIDLLKEFKTLWYMKISVEFNSCLIILFSIFTVKSFNKTNSPTRRWYWFKIFQSVNCQPVLLWHYCYFLIVLRENGKYHL